MSGKFILGLLCLSVCAILGLSDVIVSNPGITPTTDPAVTASLAELQATTVKTNDVRVVTAVLTNDARVVTAVLTNDARVVYAVTSTVVRTLATNTAAGYAAMSYTNPSTMYLIGD